MSITRATFLLIAALVGLYDLWAVRSAGYRFLWGQDLPGYYDYLGRAFAGGHLYLPIQPAPEVLALSNPWDPTAAVDFKMHDMAYRDGRYYLYHGPAPALLLFAPFRLLTGHDLPENFALFVLCFGGYLFSAGALLRLIELAGVRPPPAMLALMLLALGICQCVPYLMSRVWVYEIAIGGAYFFVSGALYFLFRGWWIASGLMFGLAVASRPHMVLVAAIALAFVAARRRWTELRAFAAPLAAVGLLIGVYNYARFANPFEFGIRYLFAGANQNRIHLAAEYLGHGLYYFVLAAPDISPVFPWVHLTSHPATMPPGYFIEPTTGALWLAPFLLAAFFVPRCPIRAWIWMLIASSCAVLLFVAATGFTTQRYEVDFLPLAVLAALAVCAARRWHSALVPLLVWSAVVNLALGITGPYDEMKRNRPQTWVHIARWFSPIEKYRPALVTRIERDFTITREDQTLWTLAGYALEIRQGKLASRADPSTVSADLPEGTTPLRLHFRYEAGRVTVDVEGQRVLTHEVGPLITIG